MNSTNGTQQIDGRAVPVADAAAKLGISERSLRRYVQRLGIRPEYSFTIFGRSSRISTADVDRIAQDLSARGRTGAAYGQVSASPKDEGNEGSGHALGQLADRGPEGAGSLLALPDAALERLGDVIRGAVAQGVQDGLRLAQAAGYGEGKGAGRGKLARTLQCLAYGLLAVTLAVCLGGALLLAARISAIG